MMKKSLVIRVEITITHEVYDSVQLYLLAVNDSASPELKLLRDAFTQQNQSNSYRGATLILEYPIDLETLRNYGGTVYYSELDLLVSMLPSAQVPAHPYSAEGRNQHLISSESVLNEAIGFGYSISIVDNAGQYGDRYFNIAGKIYRIPASKDPTRRDGIYVASPLPVQGEMGMRDPKVRYYPFELAETELGLYRTVEEAKTLGDPTTSRREALAKLEHDLAAASRTNQLLRTEQEAENLRVSREIARLEAENQKRDKELEVLKAERTEATLRAKDYYETRSYDRKDQSEAVKFIPAIIIGIGAIALALRSAFAKLI